VGVCRRERRRRCAAGPAGLALGLLMLLAPQVSAVIPDIVFTLCAWNESGTGTYSVPFEKGEWDPNSQTFTWFLTDPVEIYDDAGRERIATLLNAQVFLRMQDVYEIDVNIGVLSGRRETAFMIGSALISFPVIPREFAQARATASLTVTDLRGDSACLTGMGPPGTGAFRSYYNGYASEGTRFTHLISRIFVGEGGTASAWQTDPSCGYRPIDDDVHDISTELAFTLTPQDLAYATTTMDVPEPEEVCVGDLNGDGVIDAADLSALLAAYGTELGDPGYDDAADLDGNDRIDLADVAELLASYGQPCP
jgi:hypothetical protein